MISFPRVIGTEIFKLRRTLALLLALAAPGVVAILRAIEWWGRGGPPVQGQELLWDRFMMSCVVLWSMLMLPFLAALEAALFVELEEKSGGWKHLFVMPVERWKPVAAKGVLLHGLIGVSHIFLALWIVLVGWCLAQAAPSISMGSQLPWMRLLELVALTWMASWLLAGLHLWISLRIRNLVASMGVVVVAIFVGLIVSSTSFGRFYPWSMPVNVIFGTGERIAGSVLGSLVGGTVVTALAVRDFARREIMK